MPFSQQSSSCTIYIYILIIHDDVSLSLRYDRELQRNIEDKDKRLNEAISVLKTMRTARIVWPNPAVDVFLAGSFDGWTSQVALCWIT